MQESAKMKNLQKMKKLRSDRKGSQNIPNPSKPKTGSTIWISGDFMEKISKETNGRYLNGPEAKKGLKKSAMEEWTDSFNEKTMP